MIPEIRPTPDIAIAPPDFSGTVERDDGHALAQAIVDTIREPLIVLDKDLRVVTTNRSFHLTFGMNHRSIRGIPIQLLGNGEWDIPELRLLLATIAPRHTVLESYEVERDFSGLGRRTMRLNARQVFYEDNSHTTILLAIEDITEERARDRGLKELLHQKDVLLQEMQHRVANSLQIIAGILMLKARTVRSEETRQHLAGAHQRVMAVAAVQEQLRSSEASTAIALAPYLSRLCVTLTAAMIIEQHPIRLVVNAQDGTASSSEAVNIGLLVTELVINAIKHAFPEQLKDPTVTVSYARAGSSWRLSVSDNGIGRPEGSPEMTRGLGTTIVGALAKQLDAHVEVVMDPRGTRVTITHASFDSVTGSS